MNTPSTMNFQCPGQKPMSLPSIRWWTTSKTEVTHLKIRIHYQGISKQVNWWENHWQKVWYEQWRLVRGNTQYSKIKGLKQKASSCLTQFKMLNLRRSNVQPKNHLMLIKKRYHSFAPSILQGSENMTCKYYFSMRSQAVHSTWQKMAIWENHPNQIWRQNWNEVLLQFLMMFHLPQPILLLSLTSWPSAEKSQWKR